MTSSVHRGEDVLAIELPESRECLFGEIERPFGKLPLHKPAPLPNGRHGSTPESASPSKTPRANIVAPGCDTRLRVAATRALPGRLVLQRAYRDVACRRADACFATFHSPWGVVRSCRWKDVTSR